MTSKKSFILFIVPILAGVLYFYMIKIHYPASITGIDPEYVCLLNGLNVSLLKFHNIGFTDSPGTPFIVLAGFLLRIVHLFFGEKTITEDVLSRPDFYMQMSSYLLLMLTLLIFIWGGKKVFKATQNIYIPVFIQGTYLLSPITSMLQHRFNMDRILPLIAFVLSIYTILYLNGNLKARKYAIITGLLVGVGLITKFNFIVLAIIPLLLLQPFRLWLVYGASLITSSAISFLPIIDKYKDFTRFIKRLILHEGTYGKGTENVFSFDLLLDAMKKMAELNQSFIIILLISLVAAIVVILKRSQNRQNSKYILLLLGIYIATFTEVILASKIYKNSYMVPVVAMSGIALVSTLYLLQSSFNLRNFNLEKLGILIMLILTIPSLIEAQENASVTKTLVADRMKMNRYIEDHIINKHYLLIEPTWKAGPTKINGIAYGISYIASRDDFTKSYLSLYPKVITYENENKPFKHLRTIDADIEKIFTKNNSVYLISTPARNTGKVMCELKTQASFVNMQSVFDTVYASSENTDKIIRASFTPSLDSIHYKTVSFFTNMENEKNNWKQNSLSDEMAFSGNYSSKIMKGNKYSTVCEIDSIPKFSSSLHFIRISCKYFQPNTKNNARLIIEIFNKNNQRLWYPVFCTDYFNQIKNWSDFSFKIYIPKDYKEAKKTNIYFYNSSNSPIFIDDFNVDISFTYSKL